MAKHAAPTGRTDVRISDGTIERQVVETDQMDQVVSINDGIFGWDNIRGARRCHGTDTVVTRFGAQNR